MSPATGCWRSCSLACCFQQDHCQHTIRSAMALMAELLKTSRDGNAAAFLSSLPCCTTLWIFFSPDVQTKFSSVQFLDRSPLCIIWHWKKLAPQNSKRNPNKKPQTNSITSVSLFQIVVVAVGSPHSILFTRLNKLHVCHLVPCRPCPLVPDFSFSTSLYRWLQFLHNSVERQCREAKTGCAAASSASAVPTRGG